MNARTTHIDRPARWAEQYVGIPHVKDRADDEGADCWGLIRLVYERQLDLRLPSYVGIDVDDAERDEIRRIVAGEVNGGCWHPCAQLGLLPFDVLVFRRGRHERHVGLAIDRRTMLHSDASSHARIERFDIREWSSRLTVALRHRSLIDGGDVYCPLK